MTVLVGVLCSDGVVIGSDSSATFGSGQVSTVEQPATKLFAVNDEVLVAGTGAVGLSQRFVDVVGLLSRKTEFKNNSHLTNGKNITTEAIKDFSSTSAPAQRFGALVAFACRGTFHLCEFAIQDLQPEFKTAEMWFVSMGCGQPIADPFLGLMRRVFFSGVQPTRREGIFAALWALRHAIDLNTGGIQGPARIAELSIDPATAKGRARIVPDAELEEHEANIDEAEQHLANYRAILSGTPVSSATAAIDIPPPPTAPPPPK